MPPPLLWGKNIGGVGGPDGGGQRGGGGVTSERRVHTYLYKRGARGWGVVVRWWVAYMLNTRSEEDNTGFHSYLASFVNTFTLNMYGFLPYAGLTRRHT